MLLKELPDMEGVEMKLSELHYIQLLDEARQEILTKGDNTTHYLKEIESRLSDGEEAIKKVAELEKEIKKWEDSRDGVLLSSQTKNYKIMELEKEVERLKCCGNCKYFMYCKTDGLIYCEIEVYPFPIKGICGKWQPDGLTREERIKP
jgi:hypothetical protein